MFNPSMNKRAPTLKLFLYFSLFYKQQPLHITYIFTHECINSTMTMMTSSTVIVTETTNTSSYKLYPTYQKNKKPYVQTQYNYETNYFFAGVNLNFKNYARAQQKTQTHRNVIESVVKAATSSSFLASLTSTVNRMSQRLCVHFTQGLRLRTIQHTNPISLSSNTSDTIREHGKKIIWLEFCSLYSVQTWFNNTIHSHITAFSCIYDTPNYKMQVLIINMCKNYYGQDAHIQCHS